jgi:Holliday junction DNA helicase RuvB
MEEETTMPQDINDSAPSSLSHIIGQQGVVDQLRVALDAAFEDHRRLDDALLVGPPGLGKSQVAAVLGHELAVKSHEALGQGIKNSADLNALLLAAKDKEIVFIDEVHELPKLHQTALYLALDKRKIVVNNGRSFQPLPLSEFTILLGTTDEYCLLQPLRDRMRLVLHFEFYTAEELCKIVTYRAKSLKWEMDVSLPPLIAQRARGTPRLALRLLQSCRRVCRAEGQTTLTIHHLRTACQLEGLDELGLGPTERKYLRALAEGATRLNVLASMLALPARTLSMVTEPFLLRAGLVYKDDDGRRQMTALGKEHLGKSCPESVQLPST